MEMIVMNLKLKEPMREVFKERLLLYQKINIEWNYAVSALEK